MLQGYNRKIIETPMYTEIYDYEIPVVRKDRYEANFENAETKDEKAWLTSDEDQKDFDEMSASNQYDSLKRKQKHYKNMRFEIARIIDSNFDQQNKFITLAFKENIQEIDETNHEFNKFIKRLNYHVYQSKKAQLKYLAIWEKQKRGAIHYHIILFDLPYIPHSELMEIWGHGLVWINQVDVDSVENRGRYVSKYFDKDLELKEHKKKAFFKSQNLVLPKITFQLTDELYDLEGRELLYLNIYHRKTQNSTTA